VREENIAWRKDENDLKNRASSISTPELFSQPRGHQLMNGEKNVVYIHNGVLFSHKEK
jgi:hypothetical protein